MLGRPAGAGGPARSSAAAEDEQPALMPAARAMARAEQALDAVKPNDALPSEMEALNHLLRAEAEIQRREIARQQANSSGGGSNRNQQDLSSLFDRELQRQQETNYETPQSVEERKPDTRDELLEKVRALARRQEALARQQDDLARDRQQMDQEEVKRRLERLTRDQSELRRQAEQLAQQMQQQARQGSEPAAGRVGTSRASRASRPGPARASRRRASRRGRAAPRRVRRRCARRPRTCARRPANCGANRRTPRASAASARSTGCNRSNAACARRARTNSGGPPATRSSRRGSWPIASASWPRKPRGPARAAGEDARRRLAGEQQRLADRADALNERVQRLAQGDTGDRQARERLAEAAAPPKRARIGQQMRDMAEARAQGDAKAAAGDPQRDVARELDRLADKVGGTQSSGADREGRQLADELSKARELRDRLADLQRQIEAAGKQGESGKPGESGRAGQAGRVGQAGRQGERGARHAGRGGHARRGGRGRAAAPGGAAARVSGAAAQRRRAGPAAPAGVAGHRAAR